MSGDVIVVGSCNLDLTAPVSALPVAGQTVLAGDVLTQAGGKGANQAVAACRLGAHTTFVAAVGSDQFGDTLCSSLRAAGLDTSALVRVDGASGVALIVVDTAGENTITVASGANRRLHADHLARVADRFTAPAVLLLQLETPVATSVAAADLAHGRRAHVVLNAAPVTDADDPELVELLHRVDTLIVNEGEALALAGDDVEAPESSSAWEKLARALQDLGPSTVVITLGADGAVLACDGTSRSFPAAQVAAVDTTGAGDAFCGAYAAGLADGRSPFDAVGLGCVAGALATTAMGAQSALPAMADVEHARADGLGD